MRLLPFTATCLLATASACGQPTPCEEREHYEYSYFVPNGSRPRLLTGLGGALYFAAMDDQSQESGRLHRLDPGASPGAIEAPQPWNEHLLAPPMEFNGALYAFRIGGLWRLEGGEAPTKVAQPYYVDTPVFDHAPFPAEFAGALYFQAMAPSGERELMRWDGTSIDVAVDLPSQPAGSTPTHLTPLGDRLYFLASDLVNGYALWAFDGATVALEHDFAPASKATSGYPDTILGVRGAELVLHSSWDLVRYQPGGEPITVDTGVNGAAVVGSTLVYTTFSDDTLHREDGAGPVALGTLGLDAKVVQAVELGGVLYALVSEAGFQTVLEIRPDSYARVLTSTTPALNVQEVVAFDGALYLSAADMWAADAPVEGVVGAELWRLDPATGEVTLVADLRPGWTFVCVADP